MTDKIIISRKEIERIVKQLQNMNVSIAQSTDDLRALLDKAEVSEPVGYKVTGKLGERCSFKSSEVKKGDIIYTAPPDQSAKIAELVESNSNLKSQWMYYQDLLSLNGFDGIADCIYVNKKLQKQVAELEAEIARLKAIT